MKLSKEYRRAWYRKNCAHIRPIDNERSRLWRLNNPEKVRQSSKWSCLRRKDKLTLAQFGVERPTFWLCDICNKPISGRSLHLDHDHKTRLFRGWLCYRCNVNFGWFENRRDRVNAY